MSSPVNIMASYLNQGWPTLLRAFEVVGFSPPPLHERQLLK